MKYIGKRCFAALLAVVMVFVLLPGLARAEAEPFDNNGGTGQVGDPYQIATKDQLKSFRDYINSDSGHGDGQYFKLTDNIDLGGEQNPWTPIGGSDKFQGTFDGNGHTISGLYINQPDKPHQGLFSTVGEGGTVKNLTVGGTVTGSSRSAGIVGENIGLVENCHNTGNISGNASYYGGIVGDNEGGTVKNCYNTGDISSTGYHGGIVGDNDGTVENCYNTGIISGTGIYGGIAGYNGGTVTNCYYLSGTADEGVGSSNKAGTTVKTEAEFNSGEVAWLLQKGQGEQVWGQILSTDHFPVLTSDTAKTVYKVAFMANNEEHAAKYANLNGTVTMPDNNPTKTGLTFAGWSKTESGTADFNASTHVSADTTVYAVWKIDLSSSGTTENNPYLIPDLETLKVFRDYVNAGNNCEGKFFKLTNNIDLGGADNPWTPIGGSDHNFHGTFDGGGHTISGLYINNDETHQGLFGYLDEGGTVKNLTVAGIVTCDDYGAGIVGTNYGGTVENCHNRCDVNATDILNSCGGVVGANYEEGTVTGCYNTGKINGDNAGGVVGANYGEGTVTGCYNTGEINGDDAGGIVGDNSGTVKNCYNTGNISGGSNLGGIVGDNSGSTVTNCYYLDTAPKGIGDGEGDATPKTSGQFASGEVAWLLQEGQGEQVWGQTVGTGYPELTDNIDKAVYKITGEVEDQESIVWYSNNKATLPAAPVKAGFAFVGWSTTKSGPVNFEKDSPVNADMTVYAVFTQLQPGTGSVTMENYTCGDTGVEPEAESATNPGEPTITYKQKGADDSEYSDEKPLTAGEYTVRAVFPAANGYAEVTATADFRITHKVPSSVNGEVKCGCNSDLRLEAGPLTEVPSDLNEIYSDVEALTRTLAEQVATGANYAVYDVKIEVKEGTGDWHNAPADSLPGSVTVTLPYPNGTNSSYTFTVVHMFASGTNAGQIETPTVTKGADGLTVTLNGLSPVCVGWTAPSSGFPGFYPTYFSVTVPSDCEGGSVTADSASTIQGSKVTLTVKPDEGYHFGSLTVHDRNGKAVKVTDNGDGTYTFTMPYGQVTVKAEFTKCGSLDFTDLDIKAWYHDYTDYVINHGLMRGSGGLFEPGGTVTRAQMVTVLWNMSGKPVVNYYMTYSDVSEKAWYAEAVRWATSEGIAKGYGNGKFGPNDTISREQMAAMMYRYEQKYGDGGFTGDWMYRLPFTDLDRISDWAFEAVAWCGMRGVITGKGNGVFDPKGPAKRGELAAILTRYLTRDE